MRFDLHTKSALRPAFKLEARRLATHHFLLRRTTSRWVKTRNAWRENTNPQNSPEWVSSTKNNRRSQHFLLLLFSLSRKLKNYLLTTTRAARMILPTEILKNKQTQTANSKEETQRSKYIKPRRNYTKSEWRTPFSLVSSFKQTVLKVAVKTRRAHKEVNNNNKRKSPWTTAAGGGCWRLLLKTKQNREKNNTTIFFGENQKASENQISNNNTKSWENDANLRKEKVPELSLSLSLSLSLREFLEQKNRRRIERPRACSSIT